MATEGTPEVTTSDLLYHTCLTVKDRYIDADAAAPHFYILGTHATVEAAKTFALNALSEMGYVKSDFDIYQERSRDVEQWKHGDGIMVYAKAPAGQEFLIGTDTKLNKESLRMNPDGSVALPHGVDHLHYVWQTTIDYKTPSDRASSIEIQGAFVKRSDALAAAKNCLLMDGGSKADFVEFDVRECISLPDDWPYGENVFVHAVGLTGENYFVALGVPICPRNRAQRKHVKEANQDC